jgi:hypothetical protein
MCTSGSWIDSHLALAIQQWTIIKLVGPAANDAADRFDRWWKARRSDDLSCFTPDDWGASVRRSAASYLSRLIDHRCEMPVAYFSQHVDLWLASGQIQWHLGGAKAHIWHDAGELWCYRFPDRGRLVQRNTAPARSSQFQEGEWLAKRLIEAARAYDKLWPKSVLLVNRHAVTASPSDEELKSNATKRPKWLGRAAAR